MSKEIQPRTAKPKKITRLQIALAIGVLLVAFGMWASDWMTLQGEWTIYTARCDGGEWQGNRCTGRAIAAERYKFRALRAHSEVLFWVAGARDRSRRLEPCAIKDRRNWVCKANADAAHTITIELASGLPVAHPDVKTLPFHRVSKPRWYYLKYLRD